MASMLRGGIVINEVLVDPNGAHNYDTDGNGTAAATDEFIELYNASNAAIDISGLEFWDAGVGGWYRFPLGTILQAGAHAMVMSGVQAGGSLPTSTNPDDLFFDAGRASSLINNGGDNMVIYDPLADEYIQARYDNDPFDNPPVDYAAKGFSATATLAGTQEDFGSDIDGFSIQRSGDGANTFNNNSTPTPGTTNVCFTNGTLFTTPDGEVAIEHLRPGDLLVTQDNGPQKIQWIWARKQPLHAIVKNPNLNAIQIKKDALGKGVPARNLFVSKQHRILLRSEITERMYGEREILVPAKDLVGMRGISEAPITDDITYYHILMDKHEIIFAEGAPAESLYLGKEAVRAIEPDARDEIENIFGDGWDEFIKTPPKPARTLAKGAKVRQLVIRHAKNKKPLNRRDEFAA